MSDQQPVDMNQPVTIRLPLFQWDGVLRCLRTGNGQAFTWDSLNPLITAISHQLQVQMYPPQQGLGGLNSQMQVGQSRLNGEDRDPSAVTNPC